MRAHELLADHQPKAVIADKGYDSDDLIHRIQERGAKAVIPPRSNRLVQRPYSKRLYKTRNLVERFVNRMKHYRRIAMRFDKTSRNYLAFVHLAASLVMMGVTVNRA